MSKTKTGSNAQFTGAGKGLTVVNNRCYAYSGSITSTDSTTPITFLNYTTGKTVQRHVFQMYDETILTHQRIIQIKINGVKILQSNYDSTDSAFHTQEYIVMIPPLSDVEVLANINGGNYAMYITMTGEVYG